MPSFNLLTERIFLLALPTGQIITCSLPEVLARLSSGEDFDFARIRPHQRPGMHAFLVQLAVLALDNADQQRPPTSADEWRTLLRALTPDFDDDAPWCLLVQDWQRPAFLQPPCSAQAQAEFTKSATAAQDVDVLVTSRHHDEKSGKLKLQADELDVLVFALVMVQGWAPYQGAGQFGTMRMNGGFSSRPHFRLAFARGAGPEFCRDVRVMLDHRDSLWEAQQAIGMGTEPEGTHGLLWLLPWQKDDPPLALQAVHPWCLEVCRRIRVVERDGQLLVLRSGSSGMRVAAKALAGVVLDPWVPVDCRKGEMKALTANRRTLDYRRLHELLFEPAQTRLPLLAKPSAAERNAQPPRAATLVAQVLLGSDGGTDGFASREILLPPSVVNDLASDEVRIATRSSQFIELASLAAGKVYRPALLQYLDGGDTKDVDWQNRDFARAVEPWVARFEQAVDEAFFTELFGSLAADDLTAQTQWAAWLKQAAEHHLALATTALSSRDSSGLFAQTRASGLLQGAFRKHLGGLLTPPTTTQQEVPA